MKQVQGAEYKVVFWLCFLFNIKKVQHEKSATCEKCNMVIIEA